MSELKFPLNDFTNNRLQTLFKERLTDFEMYNSLRQLVYQTKDVQVAVMYATLGCEVGEFDDVIDVLETQFSDIQTQIYDEELDKVYIDVLIQSWQLEKAQLILNGKYSSYRQKGYNTFLLDALNDEIARQFDKVQQAEEKDKEELLSKIDSIDQLTYVEQQQIIPQLRLLNRDELIVVAQQLLKSNNVYQLLKTYILEMIYLQKYHTTVTLNFYGTLKQIEVSKLSEIDETVFRKQLDDTIVQYVSDSNEQFIISQNAKLYLALSYPFEHELFKDVNQFVSAVLHKHRTNDNIDEWIERFEKQIQQMTV